MSTLRDVAMATTYGDVQPLILDRAKRLHAWIPELDLDDCESEGNLAFVKAYDTFDPIEGGTFFSTWTWWKLRGALSHMARKPRIAPADPGIMAETVTAEEAHIPRQYLSDDAKYVLEMLDDLPPMAIKAFLSSPTSVCCARGMILDHLRGIGCPWEQIVRVFMELREAVFDS